MYHSFLIRSYTDGHLGCFQHLAIVNCAAINIGVHRFFWIGVSGFFMAKGNSIKMKREPTIGENIFANDTSDFYSGSA